MHGQSVIARKRCAAAVLAGFGRAYWTPKWSRFVLTVDDLETLVEGLTEEGVEFRNDIVENQGRKQILCSDPSGNIVELFQAPQSLRLIGYHDRISQVSHRSHKPSMKWPPSTSSSSSVARALLRGYLRAADECECA